MSDKKKALYKNVMSTLGQTYGFPTWRQHLPAIDELVSTILSQSTSDTNRDKGFYALKATYATWDDVLAAPIEDIEETIRPAGLARQKAPRIKNALQVVKDEVGELSLDFLQEMPVDEAKAWLTRIKGIGHKTAAIILLFSFNRPAYPVDTHVHRVTGRIGIIDEKTNAEKAHWELETYADPDDYYADHLNFIRHGREVCKARHPACEVCAVKTLCRYYKNLQPAESN